MKLSEYYKKGMISIIIPTHNRGELIIETLTSILLQNYKNIEVIIVDDHSTDNTSLIVEEFTLKNQLDNIIILRSEGYGACAARNLGILKSKGEFIQFFDDDDLMYPGIFTERITYFENPEVDFVTCNMEYFKGDSQNIIGSKEIHNIQHDVINHLFYKSCPTPLFLLRRSCLLKMGFWNEKAKRLQDLNYLLRLFYIGAKGVWLDKILMGIRIHSNQISDNSIAESFTRCVDTLNQIIGESEHSSLSPVISRIAVFHQLFYCRKILKLGSYGLFITSLFKIATSHIRPFVFNIFKIRKFMNKQLTPEDFI